MAVALDYDDIKKFIYEYARHQHLYNMPPAVRKRFDGFMETKNYSGHMKYWSAVLENTDQEPPQFPRLTNDPADYEKLYNMFQAAFENMAENRSDLEGKGKEDTTLAFLDKWYGPGKLFEASQPVAGLDARLKHFSNFLSTYRSKLKPKILAASHSGYPLPEKFDYDAFVSDLKDPDKYNDHDFRDALSSVVNYVQNNSSNKNPYYDVWPTGVPEYDFSVADGTAPAMDDVEPDKWFRPIPKTAAFKRRLPELFNKLVSSGTVRDDFATYDKSSNHPKRGAISSKIQEGLDDTGYDKEGDDYVKPKDDDELNIWQRFQKAKDDFKENHINPWTDMLRGRRIFFSPYARSIIEACGKVKTKDGKKINPTDGLRGILDNAEAIKGKLDGDPKGVSHFDWITKKLKEYSSTYEKAFNGAFKNPRQMKKIVSAFIIDGIKESKVAQTKTALEMLSVMKYGAFTSKTIDELKKEEFTVLSHKDLYWNKYEGGKFFTAAMDKAAKYAALGIGRVVAMVRNKWFRDHTKFRGKTKHLEKAHNKWKNDNKKDTFDANVRDELEADLRVALGERRSLRTTLSGRGGKSAVEAEIATNKTHKSDFENRRENLQRRLSGLEEQLATNPGIVAQLTSEIDNLDSKIILKDAEIAAATPSTTPTPDEQAKIDDLKYERQMLETERRSKTRNKNQLRPAYLNGLRNAIDNYDSRIEAYDTSITNDQKLLDDNEKADNNVHGLIGQVREARAMSDDWDSGHGDNYMKLMAYWDMLETYGMSHRNPWFKSMKNVRDDFYAGFDQDKDTAPVSKAKIVEIDFWNKYKQRHAA